jgi:hypothetical protein
VWTHVADAVNVGIRLASLQKLRRLNQRFHHLHGTAVVESMVAQPLLQLAQVKPVGSKGLVDDRLSRMAKHKSLPYRFRHHQEQSHLLERLTNHRLMVTETCVRAYYVGSGNFISVSHKIVSNNHFQYNGPLLSVIPQRTSLCCHENKFNIYRF